MKNNSIQPRNFTMVDVLALLILAGLAVYFCTMSFNQKEHINHLEDTNRELGEELQDTKTRLDYYQRGVRDSN